MEARVGLLRYRCRLIGDRSVVAGVAERLSRVARNQLLRAWEVAIEQALEGDPAVYVLRRVESRAALMVSGDTPDDQFARRWSERLTGNVVRTIIDDPGDGANLVKFTNQAEFVASFVRDLLKGTAWVRWFYGAFAPLQSHTTTSALTHVLSANRPHLFTILSYLHGYKALDALFSALDSETLRRLWREESGEAEAYRPDVAADAFRPLFATALRIADSLDIWLDPHLTGDELFRLYMATNPQPADWRDRTGLAAAILGMMQFLRDGRYITLAASNVEKWELVLEKALDGSDWLDLPWLQAALLSLARGSGPGAQLTLLPLRPVGLGPTPRQRKLLEDLANIVAGVRAELDHAQPDSPANALRLYTLLIAHEPGWAGDAAAKSLIERILAAWSYLAQAIAPTQAMERLRSGDVEELQRMLPGPVRDNAATVFQPLLGVGKLALNLLDSLVTGQAGQAVAGNAAIETECAGLFLLLRSILDTRLPRLAEEALYPPAEQSPRLGALLTALGVKWGGIAATSNGQIDPGIGLLAGLPGQWSVEELRTAWAATTEEDHVRWQQALLRIISIHRLARGSVMHLYQVTLEDRQAMIASDETLDLWPLGQLLPGGGAVAVTAPEILQAWLDTWERTVGQRPDMIVCDDSLSSLLAGMATGAPTPTMPPIITVPESKLPAQGGDVDPLAAAHYSGREMLVAALDALGQVRLGLPATDLTLELTASVLLRVWARWLREFRASSAPYLLHNFIRRSGRIASSTEMVFVEMEQRPLDIVLEMAGYSAPLDRVSWLDNRRIYFQVRD